MNSMEKLLLNVLQSIIPPDTMAMLQPEQMRKFLNGIGKTAGRVTIQHEDILENQRVIMEALNVGDKYCNRAASGSASLIGSGSSDGGGSGGGSSDHLSGDAGSARAA